MRRIRNLPPYSTVAEKMFAFDEKKEKTASFNSDTNVTEYFKLESDMEALNRFHHIRSMKLNTANASSAPVKRLFRLDGLALKPEIGCRIKDLKNVSSCSMIIGGAPPMT